MILTVTLNPAIDRVLLVDELVPGQAASVQKTVPCVGGKGLDASVALSCLGVPTTALAFLAGENGCQLYSLLKGYGIQTETVWVDGETRTCTVIAETGRMRVTHLKAGRLTVGQDQMQELQAAYQRLLAEAEWAILAGSLPEGVDLLIYAELTRQARAAGVPILIDAHGPALLAALSHRPEIIKMNRAEFTATFGFSSNDLHHLAHTAAVKRAELHLDRLVITCGADGMLAVDHELVYRVRPPLQTVVNAAGAGDAASAALAWRLAAGDGWLDALKWTAAVSAAAVCTEATGELIFAEAEAIYPRVEITPI